MHSRIFQLSTNPIDKEDYIEESNYYDHWFTNQIADYVNDDCDREDDITWLKDSANGYVVYKDNNNNYRLVMNSKEEYFANSYERFIDELAKIGTPTIEEFAKGISLYGVNDAYEEKFGFYVDLYGDEYGSDLMTFDDFARTCDVGTIYYIGGTVDYHC